MAHISQLVRSVFQYGVPVLVIVWAIAIVVDVIRPWPTATNALKEYPDQTAVLVGFRYHFADSEWSRSATYVLFPSVLSTPRTLTVRDSSTTDPEVRVSSTGLLPFLFGLLLAIGVSAWLWVRSRANAPPN